jgi:hypothetical protein
LSIFHGLVATHLDASSDDVWAVVGLESRVGAIERIYLSVRELLAKVQSMLGRMQDMVVPD